MPKSFKEYSRANTASLANNIRKMAMTILNELPDPDHEYNESLSINWERRKEYQQELELLNDFMESFIINTQHDCMDIEASWIGIKGKTNAKDYHMIDFEFGKE